MPTIDVDIEIFCAKCGAGLCNQTEATRTLRRNLSSFRVEPCGACLNAAWEEGQQDGLETAEAAKGAADGRD